MTSGGTVIMDELMPLSRNKSVEKFQRNESLVYKQRINPDEARMASTAP